MCSYVGVGDSTNNSAPLQSSREDAVTLQVCVHLETVEPVRKESVLRARQPTKEYTQQDVS